MPVFLRPKSPRSHPISWIPGVSCNSSCYLCLSLTRVHKIPTTWVTVLYPNGGSEIWCYHSIAEESTMDYRGVKRSGTRNREVLRKQELVKILLWELSRHWQIQVGIILERKSIRETVRRNRSWRGRWSNKFWFVVLRVWFQGQVCQSPMAAETNYHKRVTWNNINVFFHGSGG